MDEIHFAPPKKPRNDNSAKPDQQTVFQSFKVVQEKKPCVGLVSEQTETDMQSGNEPVGF